MNTTLSQFGAAPQATAHAVAQQARANWDQAKAMAAVDRMHTQAVKTVEPAKKLVQTPLEIREEVMTERGIDRLDLTRMGAQARLEAEISIDAEARERARQAKIKTTGNFVDLTA
jgi:hypothetical protein